MTDLPHAGVRATLATRLAFLALLVTLAFVHVFITFRGLSSAAGMDQAQIAREVARGNGLSTKFIRPYAWRQMLDGGKKTSPALMPDTSQPPLQPLLWAPAFLALQKWSVFDADSDSRIFLMDRAIACIGAIVFLAALGVMHGAVRRLFDAHVATLCSLVLALSQPLWDLAVSGSARAWVLLFFALAFRAMLRVTEEQLADRPATGPLMLVGVLCALMLLAHWMSAWIILGLLAWAVMMLPRKSQAFLLIGVFPLIAACGLAARNYAVCGDFLGAAKPFIQQHLMPSGSEALLRDFASQNAGIDIGTLMRKIANNLSGVLERLPAHLAFLVPALVFFPALLYRFRRPEVLSVCRGLAILLIPVIFGMTLLGLPDHARDDNAVLLAVAPAMCGFGAALLAVLWARLNPPGGWFWARWGYAVIVIAISAAPMAGSLPYNLRIGLFFKGQLFHWPPYLPPNVARLNKFVEENELILADAPWASAWYADRASVWLPVSRAQFPLMRDEAEARGMKVAGFLIGPESTKVEHINELLEGDYREWADVVLRGAVASFPESGIKPPDEFPYVATYPIVAAPSKYAGGMNVSMAFYSDRVRW